MAELWSRGFGGRFDADLHRAAWMRVPAEESMQHALAAAVERLRARGVTIDEIDPPAGWARLQSAARTINQYEGARSQRARFEEFGDRIGEKLAALVRAGLQLPEAEYDDARAHVESMKVELSSILWDYPAILTPAAAGPAPAGPRRHRRPLAQRALDGARRSGDLRSAARGRRAAGRADGRRLGPRRRPGSGGCATGSNRRR